MNPENRCPQCGAELAANAPGGLCPACMIRGALGSQATDGQSAGRSDFVPPTPAELALIFPSWKSWSSSAGAGWAWFTRPGKSIWIGSSR